MICWDFGFWKPQLFISYQPRMLMAQDMHILYMNKNSKLKKSLSGIGHNDDMQKDYEKTTAQRMTEWMMTKFTGTITAAVYRAYS